MTPAVYLILEKNGEILFGERQNTNYFSEYFSIPAGHPEGSESLTEGLIRETKEEIGITLREVELIHTMWRARHDESGERLDFFFRANLWEGKIQNVEPHKCKQLAWFSLHELPEKIMPHVKTALEHIHEGTRYSECTREYYRKLQPNFPEYIKSEML